MSNTAPTPTSAVQTSLVGTASLGDAATIWAPSDPTGATDMTRELETYCVANPGKTVKVAPGSTIKLANAFSTLTSGDILLDFTGCVVLYDHMTRDDAAIKADNSANGSNEVSVTSLSMVTVNTDATVSRLALNSTLSAKRFDWIALYSNDPNPAQPGGFLGEIFQLLTDESSLALTATRKLNRHSTYRSSVKARKLNTARRLHIRGGTFKANGNTQDTSITERSCGICIIYQTITEQTMACTPVWTAKSPLALVGAAISAVVFGLRLSGQSVNAGWALTANAAIGVLAAVATSSVLTANMPWPVRGR